MTTEALTSETKAPPLNILRNSAYILGGTPLSLLGLAFTPSWAVYVRSVAADLMSGQSIADLTSTPTTVILTLGISTVPPTLLLGGGGLAAYGAARLGYGVYSRMNSGNKDL